ncbi:MAG TPA: hypothetical protein VFE46_00215 [Pirellulales bacterium]|nr:hypothetical protein [Pirellulales bacterium]
MPDETPTVMVSPLSSPLMVSVAVVPFQEVLTDSMARSCSGSMAVIRPRSAHPLGLADRICGWNPRALQVDFQARSGKRMIHLRGSC